MPSFIEFDRVGKSFGSLRVVENLDLNIEQGEFVSLLGPSGSGKTTLLMMLAGFERPTEGQIRIDGIRIDTLPPHKRKMGVVFQNYALFPHMTVAENVAFPLQMRGFGRGEVAQRVQRALDLVQLGGLGDRKPSQLSGGQQQRVALTRALVFEPSVVLLDEPLGALDKQLRERMQLELRELHKRLGLTMVFVTHDQSEALTMSDRIAVFNAGLIQQIDTPAGIYDRPTNTFVADFIGETNLLKGELIETGVGQRKFRTADGTELAVPQETSGSGASSVSIRPESIRIGLSESTDNQFPMVVEDCVYHGDHLKLHLKHNDFRLIARTDRRLGLWNPGETVTATIPQTDCWVLQS